MATSMQQYSYRSLKATELINGPPAYSPLEQFQKPDVAVRTFAYSPDGRFFATASPKGVTIVDAVTGQLISEIPLKTVIDISFSPKGTLISTWERHIKPEEDAPPHRNLRIWNSATATEITAFSQKAQDSWAIQFTDDESRAVRIVTNEAHVYDPADFSAGIIDKIRIEGVTSFSVAPGPNPSVGFFVAEKKGAPASVKIHSLAALATTVSSKTFYKADRIQMKWNSNGSSLLFLTQTEVDKTGKSYYGETNLYMMNSTGTFDCRVTLDKEGGVHDFAWSPNDKEFVVTYGYMPSKTVIFDQRVNLIHDFGLASRNFLLYNPQGRLLCTAGFGNLAGQVDIWDRKTLKKIIQIDAPNTSRLEWSPDGRMILCATLSPRLRVDNGVKIFHYTGALLHVEAIDDLYQASWRPENAELFPFEGAIEAAPVASGSVATAAPPKPAASTGAYRPPGARGALTSFAYKREDEGGNPHDRTANNFPGSGNGRTSPSFQSRGRRAIPGAATASSPAENEMEGGSRKKVKEGKKGKKGAKEGANGSGASTPSVVESNAFKTPISNGVKIVEVAPAVVVEELSSDDKKRRALMKKLTAIDQLKVKKDNGEKLELTQHKKLDSEAEIRRDLAALDL